MADWKFELEDLEPDEVEDAPLEPESPSLENAAFLLLGVAVAAGSVLLLL